MNKWRSENSKAKRIYDVLEHPMNIFQISKKTGLTIEQVAAVVGAPSTRFELGAGKVRRAGTPYPKFEPGEVAKATKDKPGGLKRLVNNKYREVYRANKDLKLNVCHRHWIHGFHDMEWRGLLSLGKKIGVEDYRDKILKTFKENGLKTDKTSLLSLDNILEYHPKKKSILKELGLEN